MARYAVTIVQEWDVFVEAPSGPDAIEIVLRDYPAWEPVSARLAEPDKPEGKSDDQ